MRGGGLVRRTPAPFGFHLLDSTDCELVTCRVENIAEDGIRADARGGHVVETCTVTFAGDDGLDIEGACILATGNKVTGAGDSGYEISGTGSQGFDLFDAATGGNTVEDDNDFGSIFSAP
jgi:hypothetical protein